MNHYWMPLAYTVGKPQLDPWQPATPPLTDDRAPLRRVLAGLERLTQHRANGHPLYRRNAPGRHRAGHAASARTDHPTQQNQGT